MNRKMWGNLASLYSVHIFNYVLPLFLLPYLARVLGPEYWGKLAFAEAYAVYISLVVEYGFGLSGSREISRVRDDSLACSRQLASVLGAQALLTLLGLVGTLTASALLPSFAPYRPLLPLAFLLAAARSVVPLWYFQGLERLKTVALINVMSNAIGGLSILFLVRSPSDLWMPLALRASASLLSATTALWIAYRDVPVTLPTFAASFYALKHGGSLFLFRSATALYTTGNVLLYGLVAPAASIAWFAGAEKITKATINCLGPVSQAFYPRIIHLLTVDPRKAARMARVSMGLMLGLGGTAWLFILLEADLVVRLLLGPGFSDTVPILKLFSSLIPLTAISTVLGMQWLLPLRLDWIYNRIVVGAGVLNVILVFVLSPRFGAMGMAASVVTAETMIVLAIIFVLLHLRAGPWRSQPEQEHAGQAA